MNRLIADILNIVDDVVVIYHLIVTQEILIWQLQQNINEICILFIFVSDCLNQILRALAEKQDECTSLRNFNFVDNEKAVSAENSEIKNNFNMNEHKAESENENQIFLID